MKAANLSRAVEELDILADISHTRNQNDQIQGRGTWNAISTYFPHHLNDSRIQGPRAAIQPASRQLAKDRTVLVIGTESVHSCDDSVEWMTNWGLDSHCQCATLSARLPTMQHVGSLWAWARDIFSVLLMVWFDSEDSGSTELVNR
jgi:hypothetical protein